MNIFTQCPSHQMDLKFLLQFRLIFSSPICFALTLYYLLLVSFWNNFSICNIGDAIVPWDRGYGSCPLNLNTFPISSKAFAHSRSFNLAQEVAKNKLINLPEWELNEWSGQFWRNKAYPGRLFFFHFCQCP